MAPHQRTRFDDRGLVAGDRAIPFYAGALHYWRVPRARWAACLRQLHALGLTLVETPVPWRVHEPAEPGAFDWSGDRDLPAFLDAAASAGLAVALRPGPAVNAELAQFGFPDRVITDADVQAKTAQGTPVWMPSPPHAWPVPSYASTAFHAHVRRWFAEVGRVAAAHAAVVAIGVDHATQRFFRTGAFDHDYHRDALAWFDETNPGVAAPRAARGDPARAIAWVAFMDEVYPARALAAFAAILDDTGFAGLARYHDAPPGYFGLGAPRAIAGAIGGPVGIAAYTARRDFATQRHRALAALGIPSPMSSTSPMSPPQTSQTSSTSPISSAPPSLLPLATSVSIGAIPWLPPIDPADGVDHHRERDQLLTLLAAGVRGFDLVMAVERDRFAGAAIDRDGALAKHAPWIGKLVAALHDLAWPTLRRATPIALVDTRADARFAAITNVLDPVTPALVEALGIPLAELGTDPGAIAARRWQAALISALELAQVPFAIVDEAADLSAFAAVIVPTIARVDAALWTRLSTLPRSTIVVIGPDTPTRDEFDRPLAAPAPKRAGKIRAGSLDDLPGLADDLSHLVELPTIWQIERPTAVRASVFVDPATTAARAVFVYSDADKPTTASLYADAELSDIFTGETLTPRAGRVAVALPARGVRMFAVGVE